MTPRPKAVQAVLDDVVGQSELADHFGVDQRLVGMWIHRGPGNGFPEPARHLAAGKFYLLSEVVARHAANDRVRRGEGDDLSMSLRIHAETIYCDRGLHLRDTLTGDCLECGSPRPPYPVEHRELIENEPPPGSVVMSQGPTGTAWQRLHSTGRWHSVTGKSTSWDKLTLSDRQGGRLRIIYLPPTRRGL